VLQVKETGAPSAPEYSVAYFSRRFRGAFEAESDQEFDSHERMPGRPANQALIELHDALALRRFACGVTALSRREAFRQARGMLTGIKIRIIPPGC
jgi:hypothetical protein